MASEWKAFVMLRLGNGEAEMRCTLLKRQTICLLAVVAGALRSRVFGEKHGMQGRNLCLCQDFFVRLHEKPRQAFYEWVVHASPFLNSGFCNALPRIRRRDTTGLTRHFSQRSQFLNMGLDFLASSISVCQ